MTSELRSEEIYRLARELHMEYREKDRWGLKNLLRDFELFNQVGLEQGKLF